MFPYFFCSEVFSCLSAQDYVDTDMLLDCWLKQTPRSPKVLMLNFCYVKQGLER